MLTKVSNTNLLVRLVGLFHLILRGVCPVMTSGPFRLLLSVPKKQTTSQKEEPRSEKMYTYNCPTCKAVLQSAVYTGNVNMKHKSPQGKDCSRQFRVSCGQICAEYSYCFDHAKCPKHSADSYGVSRSTLPNIVECKKCGQQFRVPKNATRWKSTCPKGCRKQHAVQD